ncbi:MAG: ABC transporter permease [Clostridia bacterium]|nr:ABC transporter permease [Clostridia bacterium]
MNAKLAKYMFKRLGMALLTIFLVIVITFFTMHAIPANPFSSSTGRAISEDILKAMEAKYGFDQPVHIQFVRYLGGVLRFDFGPSISVTGSTVYDLIKGGISYSARIGFSGAAIAIILGIFLGVIAALNRGRWIDKTVQVITTALVSMPSFVMATLLLLVFGKYLRWFNTIGSQAGGLVLPTVALSLYPMAYITRLERSSMLDVLGQDYIRTARAKGLPEYKVVFKHALKNALSPVITYAGPMMAYLLTGSMVVESIFLVPGLGQRFIKSMSSFDYMMTMGVTIFLAIIIVLLNFLCDILNKVMDPRIDLG